MAMFDGAKWCSKCSQSKPLEDFHKRTASKDGRQPSCKECQAKHFHQERKTYPGKFRIRKRLYRQNNQEKIKAYDLKWKQTPFGHAQQTVYVDRYNEKYPERYKAKSLVYSAVRSGSLIKPDLCSIDGCFESNRLQAHHYDYSKPLEIIWLCQSCHSKHHTCEKGNDAKRDNLSF